MPDGNTVAQIRISEMPVATALNATDEIELNQGGTTRSGTLSQLVPLMPPQTQVSAGDGLVVTGTTALPIVALSDTFPAGTALQLLNGAYAVAHVVALRALVTRPLVIHTQGYGALDDTAGGAWIWHGGDAAADNGGTVIRCTSGPAGAYKRIFAGPVNVAWWIGRPGTPTANTAAIVAAQTACGASGGVVEFPPGTTWQCQAWASVAAGITMRLNGATISDDTGVGNLITIGHSDWVIQGGTIRADFATGTMLLTNNSRITVRDINFVSTVYNPRFCNTYAGANNGLYIGQSGSPPYAAISDRIIVDNCTFRGINNPIRTLGLSNSRISNCWSYMPAGGNYAFGAGMPCFNTQFVNMYAYGGNNYGFQTSNHNSNAQGMWQQPYRGIEFDNIVTDCCGWGSVYTGQQSIIGTGKGGVAIAGTDLYQCSFKGTVRNCCKGGGEYKNTTTTVFLGYGWTASPTGFLHHRCDIDVQLAVDDGAGFFFSNGSVQVGQATIGKSTVNSNTTLVTPWPWVTGRRYDPYNPVLSNTGIWVCLGDASGNAGNAGASAPPAGGTQAKLAGCTMAANVITYTSITGTLRVGDVVFAGTTLADQAKVTAFDLGLKTVTCDASATAAISVNVQTSMEFFDGTMWWRFFDTDRSAAPTSSLGVQVGGAGGVTVTGTARNVYQGVSLYNNISLDNVLNNVTIKSFDTDNVVVGARCGGGGTANNIVFDACVLNANNTSGATTGLWLGDAGGGVWNVVVTGGRIVSSNGSGQGLLTTAGTVNLVLDGGVVIENNRFPVNLAAAATNKISARSAGFFMTTAAGGANPPLSFNGAAGSFFDFGANSWIDNGNRASVMGYAIAGSIVVYGQPYASDLGRANAAPSTSTKGNVGERFFINPPTATVAGYVCQSTTGGAAPFTWRALPAV